MEGVGLIRAFKFAKYLPEYGWQPLILTAKEGRENHFDASLEQGIKVFRTEYRDIIGDIKRLGNVHHIEAQPGRRAKKRRIRSFARELISMPDEQIGWYKFAVEEGRKIAEEENVDIVFSTSPPETAHLAARRLKKYYNIPWVADLRDLWADDHFRPRPLYKKIALRLMEKNVLKDADFLTTVSEPWAEKLRSSIKGLKDKVRVIENGYDEEDFKDIAYTKNEKFTIAYTGKLHREHQPVNIFLKALRDLAQEGAIDRSKISVKFYVLGYDKPDIITMAESYGLSDVVSQFDKVSYDRSLEIQRSSDALLFVQWQGPSGDGWYSAKLYDYIGARRPILALAQRGGIIDDLVTKTSSGMIADDEHSLKKAILRLYGEYIKSGQIKYEGNGREVSTYTRRLRAKELAGLFDSLLVDKIKLKA